MSNIELEKKTVRDAENKILKNAARAEYVRRLRADRAAEAVQTTSDHEVVVEFLPEQPARSSTKTWSKRPAYWESIADYYSHCGKKIDEVLDVYDKEFEGYNNRQAKKRVEEWVRNQKSNKKVDYQRRSASYGKEVDLQLLSAVKERMKLGLPIDAFILRVLLIALLSVHNKLSLLKEYGGKNTFQDSWATRFYKRHQLKRRAATH